MLNSFLKLIITTLILQYGYTAADMSEEQRCLEESKIETQKAFIIYKSCWNELVTTVNKGESIKQQFLKFADSFKQFAFKRGFSKISAVSDEPLDFTTKLETLHELLKASKSAFSFKPEEQTEILAALSCWSLQQQTDEAHPLAKDLLVLSMRHSQQDEAVEFLEANAIDIFTKMKAEKRELLDFGTRYQFLGCLFVSAIAEESGALGNKNATNKLHLLALQSFRNALSQVDDKDKAIYQAAQDKSLAFRRRLLNNPEEELKSPEA